MRADFIKGKDSFVVHFIDTCICHISNKTEFIQKLNTFNLHINCYSKHYLLKKIIVLCSDILWHLQKFLLTYQIYHTWIHPLHLCTPLVDFSFLYCVLEFSIFDGSYSPGMEGICSYFQWNQSSHFHLLICLNKSTFILELW
jgi:hypothetical protein